jgi:hypothetical protein
VTLNVTLQSLTVAPLLSVRELASAACGRPLRKDLAGLAARGAENGFHPCHCSGARRGGRIASGTCGSSPFMPRPSPAASTGVAYAVFPNSTSVSAVFTTNSALFKRPSLP